MFANLSSSFNGSSLPPNTTSSNFSTHACFSYRLSFSIFTAFSITNTLLLLPFCTLILFLGLRRRWQRRSTTSHSDVFTYHMVAVEMIGISGCGVYCLGLCVEVLQMVTAGLCIVSVTQSGQIFFHILTCVERYLAVVHPIIYLKKKKSAVKFRNVLIGCAWLLFLGMFGQTSLNTDFKSGQAYFYLVLSLVLISFCNFSVLHALIRPGPGEGGGGQVNQSKKRAFHTIMAIMAALLFRVTFHLLVVGIYTSNITNESFRCAVYVSGVFFSLPSSLVLPLLFLHRAGKLTCSMKNTESGDQSKMS